LIVVSAASESKTRLHWFSENFYSQTSFCENLP